MQTTRFFRSGLGLSVALALVSGASADDFSVSESRMSYRASHFLKTTEGVSREAKGKVACAKGVQNCDFLVAVPVRSFDSGNSNRDSHMLETTRGAANPLVEARGKIAALKVGKSAADVDVTFGGKTHRYPAVPLQVETAGTGYKVHAVVPVKLSAHEITPPSLLNAAIKDDVPVTIDLTLVRAP